MLMRCLSDGLDPGDMKQSLGEVAAHLSSSGLIYTSEECGRMGARPTPRMVSSGCNDPSWWVPTGKVVFVLLWKYNMLFSRRKNISWATAGCDVCLSNWEFGK